MQIILSKEEYDALRQKEPKHLERFKQMLKEWHERMNAVAKKHLGSGRLYDPTLRDFIKDCGKTTDNVVAAWTPPKEEEGDL